MFTIKKLKADRKIKCKYLNTFSLMRRLQVSCNAGDIVDTGQSPGLGRSPGGGHGQPTPVFLLENPTDRGGWWASVCVVAKSWT